MIIETLTIEEGNRVIQDFEEDNLIHEIHKLFLICLPGTAIEVRVGNKKIYYSRK